MEGGGSVSFTLPPPFSLLFFSGVILRTVSDLFNCQYVEMWQIMWYYDFNMLYLIGK